MEGVLYDIGTYPGAIKEKGDSEIIGDIFLATNLQKVFAVLDKYEGYSKVDGKALEFVRKRSKIRLRTGQSLIAWIYLYNLAPEGKAKIKYKDYLNFLRSHKTA
jgi:gamma-glutamylcyclotransferase (GGCT)/AIG2-like uncharacterized protein YtfP